MIAAPQRVKMHRVGLKTQEDPIGIAGGVNLYSYVGNNPASYTDPFGLCPPEDDEPCSIFQRIANWGAARGNSVVVNLAAGADALLTTANTVLFGGGCSGGYSCGSPGAFTLGGRGGEAVNLAKQIASKAQMAERGTVFAGGQSGTTFRGAARYAEQYGGNAADWTKKKSSIYGAADGSRFETHWVENLVTGQRVDFKTVFR